MTSFIEQLQEENVDWQATIENEYVFVARFGGETVRLRLNDFPDEPLCTVIMDYEETDLEEFPDTWTLPGHREMC